MKKIIRLTERDLTRIVKQVVNEGEKKVTQNELGNIWDKIVTLMEDFVELEKSFEPDDKSMKREFSKYSSLFKKTLEILDPDPRE
jgi:hypothetical protein